MPIPSFRRGEKGKVRANNYIAVCIIMDVFLDINIGNVKSKSEQFNCGE